MRKINKIKQGFVLALLSCLVLHANITFAFDRTITIPAESSKGIELDMPKGQYIAKIEGGAITLSYPINTNYRWLVAVAVGTDIEGGQDYPNIGTVYFDPDPPVRSQAEAEEQAVKAAKEDVTGTSLKFSLQEDKKVRFWVSDYDYSDNNGMVKLRVYSTPA